MKCIFIGVFNPKSTNYSQALSLCGSGVDVYRYEYRERARVLGLSGRDAELTDLIKHLKPNFTLTAKGSGISPDVYCNTCGVAKHLLWYPDTMNNWNKDIRSRAAACNVLVCAWPGPVTEGLKITKAVRVPEGYDDRVDYPRNVPRKDIPISFIGNLDKKRRKMLDGIPVNVFNDAYGPKHAEIVSRSVINLNLSRPGGTSDRVYKIMAAGGFLLSQAWDGMEDDFIPGKHFLWFRDKAELAQKLEQCRFCPDICDDVARAGLDHVKQYSRSKWAEKIIKIARVA